MDNDYEANKKVRLSVVIPSHSPSFFTKMTVATLKRELGHHDLQIHIGYHSNLSDYTDDLSMFDDLIDDCHFHSVDEIDWMRDPSDIYRYSKMHAKNLENLFKNVKYFDFDYLIILDNDVYVKCDFVKFFLDNFKDCDLFGSYFQDISVPRSLVDQWGNLTTFSPKLSIWNLMISRNLFNYIVLDTNMIYPNFYDGIFYDTFARVLYNVDLDDKFKKAIVLESEMSNMIKHFFYSSFNYGKTMNLGGPNSDEPLKIWNEEFGGNYKEYKKSKI